MEWFTGFLDLGLRTEDDVLDGWGCGNFGDGP